MAWSRIWAQALVLEQGFGESYRFSPAALSLGFHCSAERADNSPKYNHIGV
jgi:hypothetical protein